MHSAQLASFEDGPDSPNIGSNNTLSENLVHSGKIPENKDVEREKIVQKEDVPPRTANESLSVDVSRIPHGNPDCML